MLSEHEKVASVLWAYRTVLRETKKVEYVMVKVPEVESNLYVNCIKFYDGAQLCGVTTSALMLASLDNFSPWWCQRVFKRTYPSIYLAVSDKNRSMAMKQFPITKENVRPDELAQYYVNQLRTYPKHISTGFVQNGMCGDDPIIQGMVLQKLQEAR